MAKKGSKRANTATHSNTIPKMATTTIPVENVVSHGENEIATVNTEATADEVPPEQHTFAKFIQVADLQTIKNFLIIASSTPEGQNLSVMWYRAMDEGQKRGYRKKEKELEAEFKGDSREDLGTSSVNRQDSCIQTELISPPQPIPSSSSASYKPITDAASILRLTDFAQNSPPDSALGIVWLHALETGMSFRQKINPTVDTSVQTEPQSKTNPTVNTIYGNFCTQTDFPASPQLKNYTTHEAMSQTMPQHHEREPDIPYNDANLVDTSPSLSSAKNAKNIKIGPFSTVNAPLSPRMTAYASPLLSSIDSELPLPANTTLFTENPPKNAHFIENNPKTTKTVTPSPPTSARCDVAVRFDHAKSSPPSTVDFEAPPSPKTTLFIENSPKSATSSPATNPKLDVASRFDRARPSPHSNIIFQPSTTPKTTPFSQNTPKIPKNIENDPKTSKFATSSPETDSRRLSNATYTPCSEPTTPTSTISIDKLPNFTQKPLKYPKIPIFSPKILEITPSPRPLATPTSPEHFSTPTLDVPPSEISFPAKIDTESFAWADEPCPLDILAPPPPPKYAPRDLSSLSSGSNPWRSLQNQKGRQQRRSNQRFRPQKHFNSLYPPNYNSTRQQPPFSSFPNTACSLDWDQDPRLSDLTRALQALGWVRR